MSGSALKYWRNDTPWPLYISEKRIDSFVLLQPLPPEFFGGIFSLPLFSLLIL
jgi:hypothetical protein